MSASCIESRQRLSLKGIPLLSIASERPFIDFFTGEAAYLLSMLFEISVVRLM